MSASKKFESESTKSHQLLCGKLCGIKPDEEVKLYIDCLKNDIDFVPPTSSDESEVDRQSRQDKMQTILKEKKKDKRREQLKSSQRKRRLELTDEERKERIQQREEEEQISPI